MNIPKPLLLGAGVIALGVVAVFAMRSTHAPAPAPPDTAHVVDDSGIASPAASLPAAPPAAMPASPGALPWEGRQSSSPPTAKPEATAAAVASALPVGAMPDPAQLQRQLQNNEKALAQAMGHLNELEASGNLPANLDAKALRTNLVVAQRAQSLAVEMTTLTQQPPSEARMQRIKAIVEELSGLQGQLRHDVTLPTQGGTAR